MEAEEEYLSIVVEHLMRIRSESSSAILSECGVPDMTVTQIKYLKIIDDEGDVTFSRLAEITRNSKPTVTEMINKFVSRGCVYREQSHVDRRVLYVRLTEKGRKIARAEDDALARLVERMKASLDEEEMDLLAQILCKIR